MTTSPLRIMQVDGFYDAYLHRHYQLHPELGRADCQTQTSSLFQDGFSAIHAVVPYLSYMGCIVDYFVSNCFPLQVAWAREQNIVISSDSPWEEILLRRRIEWFQPDVLYLADPIRFDARFLDTLSFRPRCVVGWRAADVPASTDWTGYDIMLSGLPRLLTLAETLGAKRGVMFSPGMPPWIARAVQDIPQDTDVVFVGSVSPTQHVNRLRLLQTVAEAATKHGFSLVLHLLCNPVGLPENMHPYLQPPVFGLEMHKALRRGRIVLDDRAYHGVIMPDGSKKMDLGGEDTSNMRLFEGTGGGSLVLTEALPGLSRYFEPGKEIVTYNSPSDCVDQLLRYLKSASLRSQIALAGQYRCLTEHSMQAKARLFLDIVRNTLDEDCSAVR